MRTTATVIRLTLSQGYGLGHMQLKGDTKSQSWSTVEIENPFNYCYYSRCDKQKGTYLIR